MSIFGGLSTTSASLGGASMLNPAMLGATVTGAQGLANTYINYKNYQLEKENLHYQQGLQQQIFGREDTSIQRRVADLKAAGLSPVLAAGQGASAGQVISTKAPQMQQLPQTALEVMALLKMNADFHNSLAQRKLIESQTALTKANAGYAQRDLDLYKKGADVRRASGVAKEIKDLYNLMTGSEANSIKEGFKQKIKDMQPVVKPKNIKEPSGGFKTKPAWMNQGDWEFYLLNKKK